MTTPTRTKSTPSRRGLRPQSPSLHESSKVVEGHVVQRFQQGTVVVRCSGDLDVVAVKAKTPAMLRKKLRCAQMIDRVCIERAGVPSGFVKVLLGETGLSATEMQRLARIPKATYSKKLREKTPFTGTTGQSVIGLLDLINRVEDMLAAEQDNPEARNFDVQKWVGNWIQQPQPALGGVAPIDIMDTPTGRESVMKVLGAIQSGAYQ